MLVTGFSHGVAKLLENDALVPYGAKTSFQAAVAEPSDVWGRVVLGGWLVNARLKRFRSFCWMNVQIV